MALRRGLRSTSPQVRHWAARLCLERQVSLTSEEHARWLVDPDPQLRRWSCQAIRHAVRHAVRHTIRDDVRCPLERELAAGWSSLLFPLLSLLRDPSLVMQREAALTLACCLSTGQAAETKAQGSLIEEGTHLLRRWALEILAEDEAPPAAWTAGEHSPLEIRRQRERVETAATVWLELDAHQAWTLLCRQCCAAPVSTRGRSPAATAGEASAKTLFVAIRRARQEGRFAALCAWIERRERRRIEVNLPPAEEVPLGAPSQAQAARSAVARPEATGWETLGAVSLHLRTAWGGRYILRALQRLWGTQTVTEQLARRAHPAQAYAEGLSLLLGEAWRASPWRELVAALPATACDAEPLLRFVERTCALLPRILPQPEAEHLARWLRACSTWVNAWNDTELGWRRAEQQFVLALPLATLLRVRQNAFLRHPQAHAATMARLYPSPWLDRSLARALFAVLSHGSAHPLPAGVPHARQVEVQQVEAPLRAEEKAFLWRLYTEDADSFLGSTAGAKQEGRADPPGSAAWWRMESIMRACPHPWRERFPGLLQRLQRLFEVQLTALAVSPLVVSPPSVASSTETDATAQKSRACWAYYLTLLIHAPRAEAAPLLAPRLPHLMTTHPQLMRELLQRLPASIWTRPLESICKHAATTLERRIAWRGLRFIQQVRLAQQERRLKASLSPLEGEPAYPPPLEGQETKIATERRASPARGRRLSWPSCPSCGRTETQNRRPGQDRERDDDSAPLLYLEWSRWQAQLVLRAEDVWVPGLGRCSRCDVRLVVRWDAAELAAWQRGSLGGPEGAEATGPWPPAGMPHVVDGYRLQPLAFPKLGGKTVHPSRLFQALAQLRRRTEPDEAIERGLRQELALLQLRRGRLSAARRHFLRLLQTTPTPAAKAPTERAPVEKAPTERAMWQYHLGLVAFRGRHLPEARQYFSAVLETLPAEHHRPEKPIAAILDDDATAPPETHPLNPTDTTPWRQLAEQHLQMLSRPDFRKACLRLVSS